mmetsp:Transcript_28118/g.65607  ORF Transcript_28118/g.65607 Transcript_28118/m.65607 type:complete len:286 (+) Transcript_28118:1747-2604(+)
MRVLEQHPATRCDRGGDVPASDNLLALTHRDGEHLLLALLGQLLDDLGGVRPRGEDEDEGDPLGGLNEVAHVLVRSLEVEGEGVGVLGLEGLLDVLVGGNHGAVGTHGAHEEHLVHLVQAVVNVGDGDGLGGLLVEPLAPEGLVAGNDVGELLEEGDGHGELDDVEPHAVGDPLLGLLLDGVDVEGGPSLGEAPKVVHRDDLRVELELERQQQRVDLLVDLHVAPAHVEEGLEGHLVNHVCDALGGDGSLLGGAHRQLEDLHKLRKRRLVHRVDSRHFGNQEVDD